MASQSIVAENDEIIATASMAKIGLKSDSTNQLQLEEKNKRKLARTYQ
jgi:hypothetical protein